jgi:hypothetical protein
MSEYTLKYIQEKKTMKTKAVTTELYPKINASETKPKKPKLPDTRYFQAHFEHMETQLAETMHNLDLLRQQVSELHLAISQMRNTAKTN